MLDTHSLLHIHAISLKALKLNMGERNRLQISNDARLDEFSQNILPSFCSTMYFQ